MFLGKVPFGGFLWERSFMERSFMEVLPYFCHYYSSGHKKSGSTVVLPADDLVVCWSAEGRSISNLALESFS